MSIRNLEEGLKNKNTEWGNLASLDDEVNTSGPTSRAVSPKSPDYNESTPRPGDVENIERDKRSYDRYLERMGLPPRPNKTPSPRSRSRRSPSPARRQTRHYRRHSRSRSPSPVRRYTRHYRRHSRSPSPVRRQTRHYRSRRSRSRSPSPVRRQTRHYRRHSRSRSPSPQTRYTNGRRVNASGREVAYGPARVVSPQPRFPSVNTPEGPVSPARYQTHFTENGRRVNEFGRDVAYGPPTRRANKRPIRVFNEVTRTYRPSNLNV